MVNVSCVYLQYNCFSAILYMFDVPKTSVSIHTYRSA